MSPFPIRFRCLKATKVGGGNVLAAVAERQSDVLLGTRHRDETVFIAMGIQAIDVLPVLIVTVGIGLE